MVSARGGLATPPFSLRACDAARERVLYRQFILVGCPLLFGGGGELRDPVKTCATFGISEDDVPGKNRHPHVLRAEAIAIHDERIVNGFRNFMALEQQADVLGAQGQMIAIMKDACLVRMYMAVASGQFGEENKAAYLLRFDRWFWSIEQIYYYWNKLPDWDPLMYGQLWAYQKHTWNIIYGVPVCFQSQGWCKRGGG